MSKKFKFHGSQVEAMFRSCPEDYEVEEYEEGELEELKAHDPYYGWYVLADEDTGSYDGGKSAMVDFDMYLYDENDVCQGYTYGGYYYQGGYSFDFGPNKFYEFEEIVETPLTKLNDFLSELAEKDCKFDKKIKKIKKYLKNLD